MPPDAPTPRPAARPSPLIPIGAVLGALFFAILLFSPANTAMNVQLDSSNYGSYSYFTAKDFQYGTEVVPMAGPFGFVPYGFTYSGSLFGKRLALEFFTKLALGGLIVWFFLRARSHPILRLVWLAAVATMAPTISDIPYSLAIVLSGLCLAEYYLVEDRRALWGCCAVAGYLALLTLFKGTQTMLAAATFGLLFLQAAVVRRFRRLAWIILSYLGSLVLLLWAAGQNPLNLPRYLHGILELSSGYNLAMGLDEPASLFYTGLAAFACMLTLLLLALAPRWRNPAALGGGIFLGGFLFISWKHGFVRSDGHVLIYFHFGAIFGPTILLFLSQPAAHPLPGWRRPLAAVLILTVLFFGIWADGKRISERTRYELSSLYPRFRESLGQLLHPQRDKAGLEQALAWQRVYWQIPQFAKKVGNAPVDFFGNEEGYLILNRMNYRPRPMGGGTFNVYTPWLHDINLAHVMDPAKRPEYFLLDFQTIDWRFGAQDDAGTLRAILHNYTPVEAGNGLTLFKANPTPPTLPALEPVATVSWSWGKPIPVPTVGKDELLFVTLSIPVNLRGKIRAALYKPPLVFMDLDGAGIDRPLERKVIPPMFTRPVLLSPFLESTSDVLDLMEGRQGKIARAVTLRTAAPENFDAAGLRISFYRSRRPAPTPRPPISLDHGLVSKVQPTVVEAATAQFLHVDGLVAQVLVPPGRLGFPLKGDETEVLFSYGMDPATYTLPTDGVDIMVDLVRPGQPAQKIYHRAHSPHYRPEERGRHDVRLALPPFPPGSMLYLRTDRGHDNDGAWDLAYFTGIDFVHGPYIPAQFPGFRQLPESVDAKMCGQLTVDHRDVFMLNSPGALTFRLKGNESLLKLSAGILAAAYSNGGSSDGVELFVDLKRPDGSTQRVFSYYLNPAGKPADRTDRTFDIPLPAMPADTRLVLTVGPGPAGDASWDWSYLSYFELQ